MGRFHLNCTQYLHTTSREAGYNQADVRGSGTPASQRLGERDGSSSSAVVLHLDDGGRRNSWLRRWEFKQWRLRHAAWTAGGLYAFQSCLGYGDAEFFSNYRHLHCCAKWICQSGKCFAFRTAVGSHRQSVDLHANAWSFGAKSWSEILSPRTFAERGPHCQRERNARTDSVDGDGDLGISVTHRDSQY